MSEKLQQWEIFLYSEHSMKQSFSWVCQNAGSLMVMSRQFRFQSNLISLNADYDYCSTIVTDNEAWIPSWDRETIIKFYGDLRSKKGSFWLQSILIDNVNQIYLLLKMHLNKQAHNHYAKIPARKTRKKWREFNREM